ncbi:MAG: restriction endonuclease [Gammaproteobacteria bacterium]|nr:MAG: restriction endonuclease [Gammaproteobacteria bacterium]
MLAPIVVREYARLTTGYLSCNTLDEAQISETAFDWLCELAEGFRRSGTELLQLHGQRWLRLDNFVGVLESPCGQVIEILPKHHDEGDCEHRSRELLCKLIAGALDISKRETSPAGLQLYRAPLAEWVIRQFLQALEYLVKRGLRFDYQRLEEEQYYLRGQLDVVKQMRQPPGRRHRFHIRHDVFLPDRPENRLLKSALMLVCQTTQDADNWRLAHELGGILHDIPTSHDIAEDFRRWRNERLMAHYQHVKPWCELILYRQMPLSVVGEYRGISLLFPMEKLFEDYVSTWLRRHLAPSTQLTTQASRHALCRHQAQPIFQLRPDLLIEQGGRRWVLDTKWKRLDADDRKQNYSLSQSDFYQLFAYGQRYLGGQGELTLIYPAWRKFQAPLAPFVFDDNMQLNVVPFDLDNDELLLPEGSTLPLNQLTASQLKIPVMSELVGMPAITSLL